MKWDRMEILMRLSIGLNPCLSLNAVLNITANKSPVAEMLEDR